MNCELGLFLSQKFHKVHSLSSSFKLTQALCSRKKGVIFLERTASWERVSGALSLHHDPLVWLVQNLLCRLLTAKHFESYEQRVQDVGATGGP